MCGGSQKIRASGELWSHREQSAYRTVMAKMQIAFKFNWGAEAEHRQNAC
jgi:hypothetical protein